MLAILEAPRVRAAGGMACMVYTDLTRLIVVHILTNVCFKTELMRAFLLYKSSPVIHALTCGVPFQLSRALQGSLAAPSLH